MPDRILRQSILVSPSVDALSADAERTCYRLLTIADDWGRMSADVRTLLARCYPLKIGDVSRADMERWVSEIEAAGIAVRYEVDGSPFLAFRRWRRFNKLRNRSSKFPGPGGSHDDPDNDPATCAQPPTAARGCEPAPVRGRPSAVADDRPRTSPHPESEPESNAESEGRGGRFSEIGDASAKVGIPPEAGPPGLSPPSAPAEGDPPSGLPTYRPGAGRERLEALRRPGESDAEVRSRLRVEQGVGDGR